MSKYVTARSHGKSYFGKIDEDESGDGVLVLKDVVELVTVMGMIPTGIRKNVIVAGIDYNSGPIESLVLPNASIAYELSSMREKDAKLLLEDYEGFCGKDNLVQAPPKSGLVTP